MTRELSRDATLYHAIQRVYRPAVIEHIRVQMMEAYGDTAADRLKKHFGAEQWAKTEAEATRSRAAGIVKGKPRDVFDLLDVTNLHVVLGGEFDVLFPAVDPAETKETHNERKNAVVAWARVVRSARNPMAHPVADEVEPSDALGCIASARMVVSLLSQSAERELASLMDSLAAGLEGAVSHPIVLAVLPPAETICPQFVGREDILAALLEWLNDPDRRRRLLAGSGGKGKTAIAYEFARRVRTGGLGGISAIVWLSAKRRAFVDGQVHELPHTDFASLDEALQRLLNALGREDALLGDEPTRRQTALAALGSRRCLVIVDDVDTVESREESVHEFFLEASFATESKFLFTSRRGIHGMGGATTVVPGLTEVEGMAFIAARAEMYGLSAELFTEDRCRRVLEATEGTPLYLDDLMRLIASGVPADQAARVWKDQGGERAREYALRREVEQVSHEARRLLIAATLPDQGVSIAELRVVAGLSDSAITSAVGELTDLFLLPRRPLVEGNETFQLEANARALIRSVAESDYPDDLRKLVAARQTVVGGRPGRRGPVGEFLTQASFLSRSKRFAEAEQVLAAGLDAYPEHPDLLAELGRLYAAINPPRIADAREAFRRAHDLGSRDPQMHRRWVRMEIEAGQLSVAVRVADDAIGRIPRDHALLYLAAFAHWRRGRQLASEGHPDAGGALSRADTLFTASLARDPAPTPTAFDRATTYASLCSVLRDRIAFDERGGRRATRLRTRLDSLASQWRSAYPDDARLREVDLAGSGDTFPKATHDGPTSSGQPASDRIPESPATPYAAGDRVTHPTLGRGVVRLASERPGAQVLEVDFDRFGRRRVLGNAVMSASDAAGHAPRARPTRAHDPGGNRERSS